MQRILISKETTIVVTQITCNQMRKASHFSPNISFWVSVPNSPAHHIQARATLCLTVKAT
jgi:hypothetical protein